MTFKENLYMIITKETKNQYENNGFYNSLNGIGLANGMIAVTLASLFTGSIPLIPLTITLSILVGAFYYIDYSVISGVKKQTTESVTCTMDVTEIKTRKIFGKKIHILDLSSTDSEGTIINGHIKVDEDDLEKIHDDKITFTAQKCYINLLNEKTSVFLDVQFIEPSLV